MIPQQKEDVIPSGAEPGRSRGGGILAARELGGKTLCYSSG
jgi:hypothetical protein